MTKKKAAARKPSRPRAAAAANPVRTEDVAQPPTGPRAGDADAAAPRPGFRPPQSLNFAGVGRNDICPCGSGKRFKNCHGH
jgi:preprotein translocase subunit SecA